MGSQGGPGNEPEEPGESHLIMNNWNADRVLAGTAIVMIQACMEFVIWPDRLQAKSTEKKDQLDALINKLELAIKNLPTENFPGTDEIQGKDTLLHFVTLFGEKIRRDLT